MTSPDTQPTQTAGAMPGAYDPGAVEAAWYRRWLEADLFRADAQSPKPAFSIAIPPPNITGDLHLGHAVQAALQDAWSRYRRMTGYEVLWLPGTDHAAIATQNVIEKQLALEGTTKEQLGREAFDERVAQWYHDVGGVIVGQLQELGASLDWSRTRFTLDEPYVRAIRTAFVHYYERGLIYRGPRIVNWCPRCRSAISDLEVEWQEHTDTLYSIRYPIEGSGESITIATVRPETMLFDTGVAVHPEDPRYRHLVGKTAILPLVGRRLPIVADPAVEREFGTGALKITPGHDPLDYELGERHGLPLINGLHPDGRLNAGDLPRYDGLTTLEARERVVEDLRVEEALEGERPYTHEVGHCDRCGTVLEPLVSEQWWLRMKDLAARSLESSARGEVRWHPERFLRTYEDWLRGVRDWCISRQLWLGHRIPVYTCGDGHRFASVEEPAVCATCRSADLTQDPDVLDTWFSSALWPFATLGWPEDTPDLRKFYPTSVNTTAREILPLWVARMIFSGLEFMGRVPFGDVMIHATILATDGRRMSKSLGTGVDPRELIRTYGADALRAWASQVIMTGQDVRYDESRIEGYRRFSNKLWNATKLVTQRLPEGPPPA
ncbi:MAG: valine--tRNA ligase, partial [Candidatus Dormibacteraeota bacterium]|nr:valine--tRNA ligase [Candidatus Dormibacteraeota bacterium]